MPLSQGKGEIDRMLRKDPPKEIISHTDFFSFSSSLYPVPTMKVYALLIETIKANYQFKGRIHQSTEASQFKVSGLQVKFFFMPNDSKKFEIQNLEGFLTYTFCFYNTPNIH